jgi:RNA polymerase sigma-70 factor (ECF subfamily)
MSDPSDSKLPPVQSVAPLLAAAHSDLLQANNRLQAIEQLLEFYRPYLLAIANEQLESDLRPKLGPSDVVQDTLFEAHRDFGKSQFGSEAELRAWLRRLLLNNLHDVRKQYRDAQIRSVRRESPLSGADSKQLILSIVDDRGEATGLRGVTTDEIDAFQEALARLRPEYSQLLIWHYCERRSYSEIGSLVGRSPDAIRMVCNRVVLQLRRELELSP